MTVPKRTFFSVGGAVCYNRTTKLPLGKIDIVSGSSLELTGELVSLKGGPNPYSWNVAKGYVEPKITLNCKEKPTFLYDLVLGVKSEKSKNSDGMISDIMNVVGSSLQGDDTITGVTVLEKDNLKFGRYVVVAVSATTFDVYLSTNIDQRRGMALTFNDANLLKLNSTPYELADGKNVDITELGITLEVAASVDTTDVAAGNSFEFFVVPPTEEFNKTRVSNRIQDISFGMYLYSESVDSGRSLIIDVFRCKALGITHALAEKAWDETELNIMPYVDGDGNLCDIYDIAS